MVLRTTHQYLEAEEVILDSGAALVADVLKVGHHGSENSTTYPFLREIMPKYAVISVGEDNSYGHPTSTHSAVCVMQM